MQSREAVKGLVVKIRLGVLCNLHIFSPFISLHLRLYPPCQCVFILCIRLWPTAESFLFKAVLASHTLGVDS